MMMIAIYSKFTFISASVNFMQNDLNLESQVEKFWKLESGHAHVWDGKAMSINDKHVISIWEETIRYKDGHYEIAIPIKSHPPCLPDNRSVVEKRLELLCRR